MSLETHPLNPGSGSPVFISAGVIKTPEEAQPFLTIEDPQLAPMITLGSFTLQEWQGNKKHDNQVDHIYYREQVMFGNAIGLQNPGREGMQRLQSLLRELSARGVRTTISVTNLPHEEGMTVIPEMVEAAAELGPTAVEVNLSCPNGQKEDGSLHPPLCNKPEASAEVLRAARGRVGADVILIAKDSPHATSLENGVQIEQTIGLLMAITPYVDGVTGTNTIGAQSFPEITANNGLGGMSGPAIAPISKKWLDIARFTLPDTAILSCGGVELSNVESEVRERRALGALLVGGAQEFYRAPNPARLAVEWARRIL